MDTVDVLGPRPERHATFTRELLAEAEDTELRAIVDEAATTLSTPIALVTLVLEHIQFFKAHYGLPPALAASRGTERNVSFCQFVVRDNEVFEVTDAEQDARIPQHLVKEYGIKSYLGVPVRANNIVMGSLCVMDTQTHTFSEEDRQRLRQLAEHVNARLAMLSASRRQPRLALVERASGPALAELRDTLTGIRAGVADGHMAYAALRSYYGLVEHGLSTGTLSAQVMARNLKAALGTLEDLLDALYDIETNADDTEDACLALEKLLVPTSAARLSDVLIAGQDLAQQSVRNIGGTPLPELLSDPTLATPRPLAVALLGVSLANVAAQLGSHGLSSGIQMAVHDRGSVVELSIAAQGLPAEAFEQAAAELSQQVGDDPTVAVQATERAVQLSFTTAHSPDDNGA